MRAKPVVIATLVFGLLASCAFGTDGEGPRYIGRVVSASPSQVCVGPNSSTASTVCAAVPHGVKSVPVVGECVALFAKKYDKHDNPLEWTSDSMKLKVKDSECE